MDGIDAEFAAVTEQARKLMAYAESSAASGSPVPGARDGETTGFLELVASPLRDFDSLTSFFEELRRQPGMIDVQPVEYHRGMLRVVVRHRGPEHPAAALLGMSRFHLRLVSANHGRMEVVVESRTRGSTVPPGTSRHPWGRTSG